MSDLSQTLRRLIELGRKTSSAHSYNAWSRQAKAFLEEVDKEIASKFAMHYTGANWGIALPSQIGMLEGMLAHRGPHDESPSANGTTTGMSRFHPKRVFIVHGHDSGAKESVARFVKKIGLEPVILHEQPRSGRTVIEQLEIHGDSSGFAIVLLTPDDVGASASKKESVSGRARQNVILELGYFLGKLSRRRVCALYKDGVEIPSDINGVLYVPFDADAAWRMRLAQELIEVGFSIDLKALIKT